MSMLQEIITANRNGEFNGIYAICSAHPLVIEAAIEQAKSDKTPVLIEATANQVNQFGGYTGMKPKDFVQFVFKIAEKLDFPKEQIILGGDHLGPVCWQSENAEIAMSKAQVLIADYITAGFKKIHLDCSMPCADDDLPLSDDIIAQRAASLCKCAEDIANSDDSSSDIVYVIGTEVPPPGGANEVINDIDVTKSAHALQTIEKHCRAFEQLELSSAWSRVVGLVVQPGVEFDHTNVHDYQPAKTNLLKAIITQVDNLVFEAHSTDYQTLEAYQCLIQDHFAILKVGPQLTFALREALFALSYIEEHLFSAEERSNLRQVCEQQMLNFPNYWQSFYNVNIDQQALYRAFSYSDRIRYYWPNEEVQNASDRLFKNLEGTDIPLPLISQFLPEQYKSIRNGQLENAPKALVKAKIKQVTNIYAHACWKQVKRNINNYA